MGCILTFNSSSYFSSPNIEISSSLIREKYKIGKKNNVKKNESHFRFRIEIKTKKMRTFFSSFLKSIVEVQFLKLIVFTISIY